MRGVSPASENFDQKESSGETPDGRTGKMPVLRNLPVALSIICFIFAPLR
jgi:hypothetical protein